MTDSNKTAGEDLHTLAHEVVEVMKGVCGKEVFSRGYSVAHRRALSTRERRKKQAALEVCVCVFSLFKVSLLFSFLILPPSFPLSLSLLSLLPSLSPSPFSFSSLSLPSLPPSLPSCQAVVNPEKTIRRRQKKHLLTKASKRRKILIHRPMASSAKRLRTRHS